MASPFQQQSVRRKLIYTALILVLFAITTFGWRGLEFRNVVPPAWTVAAQANELGVRQRSHGEVELTGAAVRLSLTGSRGLVVCYLWNRAMDKQKRHEWNEVQLLVRSITKLEPHYIVPWLFQSWNLAYNVSVESELLKDRYYYMAEGIKLLGEGERQNANHPDLRHTLGFYYQHKIGLNDQANTIRSLCQLSCVDPREWDPDYLRPPRPGARPAVDLDRFEQFCVKHPMLVRRLRENLHMDTPDKVVDFLRDHRKIPSRYEDTPTTAAELEGVGSKLKPAEEQFPVLPPKFDFAEPELTPDDVVPDEYENFSIARAWFAYALKPLPPASDRPSLSHPPFDRTKYKLPRYMAHEIFRGYAARGQTYVAEKYQDEGWFERDGWLIPGWFKDDRFRGTGGEARVGAGRDWGRSSWERAFSLWQQHGTQTGLYKTAEQLKNLDDRAQLYRKTFEVHAEVPGSAVPEDSRTPEMLASWDAHDQLYWYGKNRMMTNFPHFYFKSYVERQPETVAARKALYEAERLRKLAKNPQALAAYRRGLAGWRDLLLKYADFADDSNVQEESYEIQLKYLDLLQTMIGHRVRPLLEWQDLLAQATPLVLVRPAGVVPWLPSRYQRAGVPLPFVGPFDGNNDRGEPLIAPDIRRRVRSRLGYPDAQPVPTEMPPAAAAATAPGGPMPSSGLTPKQ